MKTIHHEDIYSMVSKRSWRAFIYLIVILHEATTREDVTRRTLSQWNKASMLEENLHLHEWPEREAVANAAETELDDEVWGEGADVKAFNEAGDTV